MKQFLSLLILISVSLTAYAQNIVKGTVVDATGEPILGAAVMVVGTTTGTITDLDGNFSIENVAAKGQLQITYVGFTPATVAYTAGKAVNVTLEEDNKNLEEVVVVGFGTQKKVNLTGSVATVDSKALASRPVTNATQALQGLVPGLQISSTTGSLEGSPSINIRGVGTIGEGSSGSPLILIDGMEGDLNTINPQDIENVSVLKDAAAASIYGSRAPFGVILVTTKNGHEGKLSINYNDSFRFSAPINMPHTMDSWTFANYVNDGCDNTPGWSPHFTDEHLQRIQDFMSGKLTSTIPADTNGHWKDGYGHGNDNVDWYDVIYKKHTFSQEHNVSAQGGGGKTNYYVSLNYLNQSGIINLGNEGLDRYNVTAKLNTKLADWATFKYTMRWTRQNLVRPSSYTDGLYQNIGRQGWPTLPLYDPNGFYYDSPSPALGLATGGDDKRELDRNYYQAALVLEPIKNWVTNIEFNYNVNNTQRHWEALQTYNHDVNGVPYLYRNSSEVHEEMTKENFWNLNIYTSYEKSINKAHNIKGMVGFQTENMHRTFFEVTRQGIMISNLPELDLTTGADYKGNAVAPTIRGNRNEWATAGFFGRINYDYKGRYLLEANFRYDGTSRFREDNRWIALPSVSFGWNVARESFWSEELAEIWNTAKVRVSWGKLGNQNTNNWYQTYRTIAFNTVNGSWLQGGVKPNTAGFPALVSTVLTWETIQNTNIGIDLGFLNNRLTANADFYVRNTENMVGNAPELPAVLGASVPLTNNTDLKTTGWELQVAWNDILENGLGYGIKATLADSKSKITRYPNNPTGSLSTYIEGRELGEIWGYKTIGIARSNEEMQAHLAKVDQSNLGSDWAAGDIMYADLNGDGKINAGASTISDPGDRKVIGNNTPRYHFGLDLNANWKGFDVRVFFQGVAKRDYAVGSGYFWGADSNFWWSMGLTPHVDYFRTSASNLGENLDSYYPRPVYSSSKNTQTQSGYLQDASYIRLKNVQLGYSLPKDVLKAIHAANLRVFVSGENLWTGTSLNDLFDPETISGGWNGCVYPLSRTISCGLSLTF